MSLKSDEWVRMIRSRLGDTVSAVQDPERRAGARRALVEYYRGLGTVSNDRPAVVDHHRVEWSGHALQDIAGLGEDAALRRLRSGWEGLTDAQPSSGYGRLARTRWNARRRPRWPRSYWRGCVRR